MPSSSHDAPPGFSADERARFARDGFIVVPNLSSADTVARMRAVTERQLADRIEPLEYEADTGYPGAPTARAAPGGRTVRRLLRAYDRDPLFREWVHSEAVGARLRSLLGPDVVLATAHHNCVMTKQPAFSSITGWHQDIRYWSFERPDLVSIWLALGEERVDNGCLLVVPGSHAMDLRREQYDDRLFFRTDLAENQALLARAVPVELHAGDVLFFHCRLLHAAGRNQTSDAKLAVVFTFHAADNHAVAGTRSASLDDIAVRE